MTNPSGNGSALEWFKSSYSTNDGPECVEVAFAPRTIRVRDSKHAQGPQLAFGPRQWAAFVSYATDH
ncbi:DUF397 domain-containing protein [Streptomyces sp. NBC_00257]|uniref:DUF397 domain-containing protein n=1 Tax=unclassified Streptomyces TaxID=2593676 RepID=UPI0022549D79|nr:MULTISPECIES: DUF397 domain-containing protein [unclassified Streptomyces]MCX5428402.1 DUF397 domain-containing protein [Streptomyces sp. NBC_00062]